MKSALTFYKDPEEILINQQRIYNPESLGLPYSDMISAHATPDQVRDRIVSYCIPVRQANPNFSVANALSPFNNCDLQHGC